MDRTDVFGRLEVVLQGGVQWLVALQVGIGIVLVLTALRRRRTLFFLLFLSLMFAAAVNPRVDAFATIMRWVLILSLGLLGFLQREALPRSLRWLGAYGMLGFFTLPLHPNPTKGFQYAFLFGVTVWGFGRLAVAEVKRSGGSRHLLEMLEAPAAVYVVMSLLAIPMFEPGRRFSGAYFSPTLFSINGGLLLPVLLWLAGQEERGLSARLRSLTLFLLCGAMGVVSGQRIGVAIGFIGCLPMLLQFGRGYAFGYVLLAATVFIGAYMLPETYDSQVGYVVERYTGGGLTGREERWERALALCLEDPLLGRGMGSTEGLGFGFHNAYLTAWYEGGLIGLFFFIGALGSLFAAGLRATFNGATKRERQVGALILGFAAAFVTMSVVESKLMSPSNVTMVFLILFGALAKVVTRYRKGSGMGLGVV